MSYICYMRAVDTLLRVRAKARMPLNPLAEPTTRTGTNNSFNVGSMCIGDEFSVNTGDGI